jgi:hypothetical protein
VSCAFSQEWLALYVEGDLCGAPKDLTEVHLARCRDCAQFLGQLHDRQSLLKSLRRETVTRTECAEMRRTVMTTISDRRLSAGGWLLRIERAMVLGVRRQAYAMAAVALLVVSGSVVAQNRSTALGVSRSQPIFEGRDTLIRPEGYRDWVRVNAGLHHAGVSEIGSGEWGVGAGRVYINPTAYREYEKTRTLPEGTVMIWESAEAAQDAAVSPHPRARRLLASVKDSTRFGGWGFFDFTSARGAVEPRADRLPESSGCQTCHRREAEVDQVITRF